MRTLLTPDSNAKRALRNRLRSGSTETVLSSDQNNTKCIASPDHQLQEANTGLRSNSVAPGSGDFLAQMSSRKDIIMLRHIYIVVWCFTMLALYHVIYLSPLLHELLEHVLALGQEGWYLCTIAGSCSTLVNSTMVAIPLVKSKICIKSRAKH